MSRTATNDTILLSVSGMTCAGCVRTVETALSKVPGVRLASVNFAGQTAAVSGDVSEAQLISAVLAAGYEASALVDESVEVQEAEATRLLRNAVLRSLAALTAGALLMGGMWAGLLPPMEQTLVWLFIGAASLVLMLYAGGHFFRGAFSALRHASTTMDTLIALGTGAAWIYSMIVVLLPDLVPEGSRHQFFEASLFVIGFVNLGKALEMNARARASVAIQKLFDLTPRFVTVIEAGEDRLLALSEVVTGQLLRIRPGENFSVDGKVVSGDSAADESLLTGESVPVPIGSGNQVHAGTRNLHGSVVVEAGQVGQATRLAAITRLVTEAQNTKPAVARLVDQVTAVFVPAVLLVAMITFMAWWWFGPAPQLSYAFVTAMSVLIIACPCALGLAVPMSIMVGLGRAAAKGLLVRNSEILQVASKLDVIVLDKTGTLTQGEPVVNSASDLSTEQLSLVLGMEQQSDHPVAVAIASYCRAQSAIATPVTAFRNHPGGGVTAQHQGQSLVLGSLRFLNQQGVQDVPPVADVGTIVALAIDGHYVGHLLLSDKVRESAASIIQSLVKLGVRPVMLTGDRVAIAKQVATEVGIEEVHAEVSPEDKLDVIRRLQAAGHRVGMVGDGINDAAALSAADVGFAMGLGSDVALESADITLRNNSLEGIEATIRLSRKVLSNVHQNLVAAFAYNVLLIPVAAGALYPFYQILINPALAGLAMALSSLTVVLNAGRLRFQ